MIDGSIYEGAFEEDCPEGEGIYYYPDGVIYKGPFRGGRQHGRGVQIDERQRQRGGEWEEGRFKAWL